MVELKTLLEHRAVPDHEFTGFWIPDINRIVNSRSGRIRIPDSDIQLIGQLQLVLQTTARLVLQKSMITSLRTFETNYTGFRFGSEFRLNFVYLFSAACVVKLLHTSQRCFLLFQAVMRCSLIARLLVVISLFHGGSPRPLALVGLRSLSRLHGTHSQHPWKMKICLLLSSDQNSKLTF